MEIQDQIIHEVTEFPISLEEAKESRLNLMEDRNKVVERLGQKFASETFMFC
jgi:hypothetical protein